MNNRQLKTLQMLENQEITVDEAMLRLREGQEEVGDVAEAARGALSQIMNEVGASLKEAGVAVNEVMTEVGSGLRSLGAGKTFEFEHAGQLTADKVGIELGGRNGPLVVQAWHEPGYLLQTRVGVRGQSDEQAQQSAASAYSFAASQGRLLLDVKEGRQGVSASGVLFLPASHSYELDLQTSNGTIRAEGLCGSQLVADTSNGAVTIEQCDFDTVSVKTSNGAIRVHSSAARGTGSEVDLATSNGSISITLRRDSEAEYKVEASTSNGRVRAELNGLQVSTTGKNYLYAESDAFHTSDIRVRIVARTSNGSISITHV